MSKTKYYVAILVTLTVISAALHFSTHVEPSDSEQTTLEQFVHQLREVCLSGGVFGIPTQGPDGTIRIEGYSCELVRVEEVGNVPEAVREEGAGEGRQYEI